MRPERNEDWKAGVWLSDEALVKYAEDYGFRPPKEKVDVEKNPRKVGFPETKGKAVSSRR